MSIKIYRIKFLNYSKLYLGGGNLPDDYSVRDNIIIKKMLALLKPYIRSILLFFFIMLLSTGISFVLPQLSRLIIDKGFLEKDFNLIMKFSFLIFTLILIDAIISVFRNILQVKTKTAISYDLFQNSFKKLCSIKSEYFHNNNYTEIFSRLNYDINNITLIVDGNILFILAQVLRVLGGLLGLLLISRKLTLIVLIFIPIRIIIFKALASRRKAIASKSMNFNSELAHWFGESIGGIKEIKLFTLKDKKLNELHSKLENVNEQEKKNSFVNSLNQSSEQVLSYLLSSLIYIFGAVFIFADKLSLGSVLAFITYATYVTAPISSILNIGFLLSGVIPSAKRYFDFMNLETEFVLDKPVCNVSEITCIEFKNVTFSYDDRRILNDISFTIQQYEKVAFVGYNASGKTTIVNLLLRLNQIDDGSILLNEIPIYSLDIESYRKKFAVVSQDIFLFNTTIEDNIRMGIDNQNEKAHIIDEFIGGIPLNYNIGTHSSKLSGGQKQKIAIARALYKDADIYIFDEATSNIDGLSENYFNELINLHLKEKMVIIITHKHEILSNLDKVIFMQDGKVCAIGKHEDLLVGCEQYKIFISKQALNSA